MGALTAARHTNGAAFGQADLDRAQMIGAPLAAAVRVARLFEGLRKANSDLLESNQHKSTFMTNMSHELRTPLTSILGFSELLRDDKSDRFDAATKHRFLEQIHTSGQHLLGLINDLLDLSKVEAGQMDPLSGADRVDARASRPFCRPWSRWREPRGSRSTAIRLAASTWSQTPQS